MVVKRSLLTAFVFGWVVLDVGFAWVSYWPPDITVQEIHFTGPWPAEAVMLTDDTLQHTLTVSPEAVTITATSTAYASPEVIADAVNSQDFGDEVGIPTDVASPVAAGYWTLNSAPAMKAAGNLRR